MAALTINSKIKLPSGYEIPQLGFGVYQTPANQAEEAVAHSFQAGYRHIDSAAAYRNEAECGKAVRGSSLPRDQIFFTSKIPPRGLGYESAKAQVVKSLKESGLDYIDLMLLHAPYGGPQARKGAWKALVEAVEDGKIRSIGVSNYGVHHLDELETHIAELEAERGGKGKGGVLSLGQWEIHPWLPRNDIAEWCAKRDVAVEAYCPIVRGERFGEPVPKKLAAKYGKTEAQVLIRWSLQKGFIPLPKSVTPSRIKENADVYDFELTPEEVDELTTDEYAPCAWDPTVAPLES
ncbi:NADP-dependent oxidoreductase domain-containing protein [Apodospora peruviana]|uniref:NADP-dependent oxidoreductase domain-containing protein n=1 Tax=Apodospora peruviana TaxID=516989 RepID=A0AAE0LZH9_9PEZI|nr:NADP-dependent oxidoreductase domain-containing protein [Apodospora peruviana]KAK3313681.1 NADP-dependent oxidoreductase domain-containing protein [Apodospora peruviana]